ncbi:MAG: hypothetical protein WA364_17295 [Candidatus Nitrosopolaris sp.]
MKGRKLNKVRSTSGEYYCINCNVGMKGTNERKLKGFVVRKQVKDHVLKLVTKDRRGLKPPVVMADDVLTTGVLCLSQLASNNRLS